MKTPPDAPAVRTRRLRYAGKHPRGFHEKYKEHDRERYAAEADKIAASGKTLAGTHRPIMVEEVLEHLRPAPGNVVVDCTLGGGGHAQIVLGRILPGGRLIGLDVDPLELPRAEARLRAAGFGPDVFVAHQSNFAGLAHVLATEKVAAADRVLVDLGVSSMQLDNPDRGFSYKEAGPLDMRMNPSSGERAAELIRRVSEDTLTTILTENADEPHAALIAGFLKRTLPRTTQAADRAIRGGLEAAVPSLTKPELKMSVRRTLQALRIAVNDEFSALDWLLRSLPGCLAPGGRVAVLAFHSGEDRRVKKAFQAGYRAGIYAEIADTVTRPCVEETRANRRASSAKLRWAVRGDD